MVNNNVSQSGPTEGGLCSEARPPGRVMAHRTQERVKKNLFKDHLAVRRAVSQLETVWRIIYFLS